MKLSEVAKELIAKRKGARERGNKVDAEYASKRLQKEIRSLMRAHQAGKIRDILSEFRGLRNIAGIRNNGKRKKLTSVVDKAGQLQASERGIVDAFAEFYETLYIGETNVDTR